MPVRNLLIEAAIDGAELSWRPGAIVEESQVLQVSGIQQSLAEGYGLASPGRRISGLQEMEFFTDVTLRWHFLRKEIFFHINDNV